MKTKIIMLLVVLSALGTASIFAQKDPFMPLNPSTLARGGSFTADAQGYNAFFYNPAGFAKKGELTLLSTNIWAVMDARILNLLYGMATGQETDFAAMFTKKLSRQDAGAVTDGASAGGFTIPPELESIMGDIEGDATLFGDYIAAALESDPEGFQAALVTVLDSPELSAIFTGEINPESISDPTQLISSLNLSAILADPGLLTALLEEVVVQVQAETGEIPPTEIAAGGAAYTRLETSVNDAITETLASFNLPKGNMDVGAMFGLGWTGYGLGLGAFINAGLTMRTPDTVGDREGTILDAKARVMNIITLAGGLGLNLGKDLAVGVGLRPTVLSYGDISPLGAVALINPAEGASSDPFTMINALIPAGLYKSFYMGLDVGATYDMDALGLTFGVAAKDILPIPVGYYNYLNAQDFVDAYPFQKGGIPVTSTKGLYTVPAMKVNAGAMWHPDLGILALLIDPRVSLDVFDMLAFVRNSIDKQNTAVLTKEGLADYVGLGAQLRLLSILQLRAGWYQGAITGGLGLDLPFAEINLAGIARNLDLETADKVPSFSEAGLSLEVALRF